jgi:serine/threonine-protein kinase
MHAAYAIPDTRNADPLSAGERADAVSPLASTVPAAGAFAGTAGTAPLGPLGATAPRVSGGFDVMRPDGAPPPTSLRPVPRPAPPAKRAGLLSSLPAILLLAGGVSAAVVGGVYLAHDQAKADDHDDPPTAPPPTTVPADPPPADTSPTASNPPAPQLKPVKPVLPGSPNKPPGTKPSSGPPSPSSTAPEPLFPLPITLPSNFPVQLPPFFGPQRDDPPPNKPAPSSSPRPQQAPRGERHFQGLAQGRPRIPSQPGSERHVHHHASWRLVPFSLGNPAGVPQTPPVSSWRNPAGVPKTPPYPPPPYPPPPYPPP